MTHLQLLGNASGSAWPLIWWLWNPLASHSLHNITCIHIYVYSLPNDLQGSFVNGTADCHLPSTTCYIILNIYMHTQTQHFKIPYGYFALEVATAQQEMACQEHWDLGDTVEGPFGINLGTSPHTLYQRSKHLVVLEQHPVASLPSQFHTTSHNSPFYCWQEAQV